MPILLLPRPAAASTIDRTITDNVGVTDTGVLITHDRAGTEAVGVTENVGTVLTPTSTTHSRTITEDVGVTDAGTSVALARAGTESVGVVETVNAVLSTPALITRTITDNVGVTDADSPELIETVTAVTARSAIGIRAHAATQLRSEASLAAWVAKWEAIPINGPGTGTGGWRAGDGGWSVTHTNGASALFSYGDTPVSKITPVVLTGASATVQGTANAWVTVLDGDAPNFPDGTRLRIYLSDGTTLRFGAEVTRRITGRNSAFGYTNLQLDFALPTALTTGDIVKGASGGEEWYMFPPHSSAVLYCNGQMRVATGIDSWIPRDTSSDWYWAGPMAMEGNDLYVFPTKQDNSAVPWADVGRGLFKFDWDDHTSPPTGVTKITTWGLDPCWGAAVVQQGGFYYIFGTYRQRTGTPWFDNEVYLARTASLTTAPTSWEFWTSTSGGTWATGAGYLTSRTGLQVVIAHDDVNGLENTFSAHYVGGKFTLASKRGGVFGSDVALWESTTITGPYTRRVVGSAPNDTPTANDQTYLTNAHYNLPALANGNRLISVSRNRDGQTIDSFFNTDPTWYRPLWLEVSAADVRVVTGRSAVGLRATDTARRIAAVTGRSALGLSARAAGRAPLGQPTETDLAQPIARRSITAIGQPAETDAAQAIARRKTRTTGQPAEVDAGQTITRRHARTLGQPAETGTVQPVARRAFKTVGQIVEVGTAQPVTSQDVVGQAEATETAQPIGRRSTRTVGQVAETDSASLLTRTRRRTLAQPSETDTSAVTARRKARGVAQAATLDAANLVAAAGRVRQVAETDTANPVARTKRRTLGQVTEVATLTPVARRKARTTGQPTETDTVTGITSPGRARTAFEVDTAQPVGRLKRKAVAQVTGTHVGQAIGRMRSRVVGQPVVSDIASAYTHGKRMGVGQAGELDAARPITEPIVFLAGTVGPATGTALLAPAVTPGAPVRVATVRGS